MRPTLLNAGRPPEAATAIAHAASRSGLALLALSYLVPAHFLPWVSFHPQWASAMAFVLLGWSLVAGGAGKGVPKRFPLPRPAMLALALSAVPLLQHASGLVPFLSDALLPALYLQGFALSVVTGAVMFDRAGERAVAPVFNALLVAACVSVAIALAQWLQLGSSPLMADVPPGGRPGANLAQPNHLATLLALGVVALLRIFQARRMSGPVCGLLLGWLGLGLLMTQSRTGWLSITALAGIHLLWGERLRLRAGAWTVVGVSIAFVAANLAWPALNKWLLLDAASLAERFTPGSRLVHWPTLWDAVWREPWLGYGWQQVTLAQQAAVLDHPRPGSMLQNSHNVVLDLLIWNGIPIGAVVVMGCGWWIWRQARSAGSPIRLWLWCALIVIVLHAQLEYPLDQAYFLLPLGLFVGMLDQSLPGRALSALRSVPRAMSVTALAVMTGLLVWIGSEYLRVEQANHDVRLLLAGIGVDRVPRVPPPDVLLLDGPREYHRFMITPARGGLAAGELDWMRTVSLRNAYPPAMLRFALAAGLNGRPDEAAITLRRLCAIHPPVRCEEGREAWKAAQRSFPALTAVPAP